MRPWPHVHTEMVGPGRTLLLKLRGPWLFDGEERFPSLGGMSARIQIGDFEELGRGLVIDGTVQLTEAVDALYTTALVFPAALSARSRRRWLVVGGGDGATAREALRFRDTESVRLVDISRTVVERTQELIPSFWSGCQHDPRLEIIHRDAGEVLRDMADRGDQVDVILYDLSDPGSEECNPFFDSAADHMYTEEAFRLAARGLSPGGVFAAQLAELSIVRSEDHYRHRRALKRVFRHVHSYRTFVEPFGYAESFIVASNDEGDWNPSRGDSASQRLPALYAGDFHEVWSAPWHEQLFALPPSLVSRLH
jgi:spermidine synthase